MKNNSSWGNDITELALGSVFNKVVLLKFTEDNLSKIKQNLLNYRYKKSI